MTQVTEHKARSIKAGEELDRICAEWMGYEYGRAPQSYSTDWAAAGPLLEAMTADLNTGPEGWLCITVGGDRFAEAQASSPTLAIARTCAVLVARGITLEDVEGTG